LRGPFFCFVAPYPTPIALNAQWFWVGGGGHGCRSRLGTAFAQIGLPLCIALSQLS